MFYFKERVLNYSISMTHFSDVRTIAGPSNGVLIERFRSRGYVTLEDVIDPALPQAALRSLEQVQDCDEGIQRGLQRSERDNKAGKVDFAKIPNLAKKDEAIRELASSEAVVNAVERIEGLRTAFSSVAYAAGASLTGSIQRSELVRFWEMVRSQLSYVES